MDIFLSGATLLAEVFAHNQNSRPKHFTANWSGATCLAITSHDAWFLQTAFGLIRMTAVVVPFLYVGTLISKNFAALLEEHDIFVPEDDDDDDWAELAA